MYKHLTPLHFLPFLLTVIILTSCQREINFGDNDTISETDSTLLIKSIGTYDLVSSPDSLVENYSYDTINRIITLTWNDPTSTNIPDGTKAEFRYNSNWMISHAQYIYPAGYVPQAWDYITIDVVYDAEKILQRITVSYGDGNVESKDYTKALLSSGSYQLSWDESDPAPVGTLVRRAVFNADGKNTINVVDHSYVAGTSAAGDDIFTDHITSDTLFYDAAGNLSKIIRNEIDTLLHSNQSYVSYNFSARQTRGDQLYRQRQLLMRGIANMPFFDGDSNVDLFGILAFSLENEHWQYLKYPVQTADIHWLGDDYHFTGSSEFDALNRLVKMKTFMLDLGLTEGMCKIKYYK